MKSLGLLSQILTVGLALTIGYFYVQPTVAEIGEVQTEIDRYETERKKIEVINDQLAMHQATLDSIPPTDKVRLATYMPRVADDISIMRDISFIVERANVTNTALSYDGSHEENKTVFSQDNDADSRLGEQAASPHAFTVEVQGSYDEIKNFLRLLEMNEYPLEVHQLSLSSNESGESQNESTDSELMTASMTLVTYVDELVLISSN